MQRNCVWFDFVVSMAIYNFNRLNWLKKRVGLIWILVPLRWRSDRLAILRLWGGKCSVGNMLSLIKSLKSFWALSSQESECCADSTQNVVASFRRIGIFLFVWHQTANYNPLYYCYFRQFSGPTHRSADSANRREIRSKSVKDLGSHTLTNIVNITSIRGRVNISFIKISVCLLPLPCVLN